MKLNLMAPCAHRITASAFALVGCLVLPAGAAVTNLNGDHAVVPNGDSGSLSVAGDLEVGSDVSAQGTIDFGLATNPSFPGVTMRYLGSSEHDAAFDLTDSLGSFLWRDNTGATARSKMKLGTDNVLSLYNSAGSTATITLQGGTGQLHLAGTGSGIYANGTSVFTVGSTGSITWDRALGITNATVSNSSTTGALTVAGGIGVALDSHINGVRVGRGKGNYDTNVALGPGALYSNTSGSYNAALGAYTLQWNTTGHRNTAVGTHALNANTTGVYNTAMGHFALGLNTYGSSNTAVGRNAMRANSTGSYNIAMGEEALANNTTASFNTAIGRYALTYNNANGNTAIGDMSQYMSSSGTNNTGLGTAALFNNSSGSNNIGIGYYAGRYQANGSTSLTDPENSIYIGNQTRGFSNADSNSIVIGYQAIGEGANTTVIGSSSTTSTHLYGQTKADSLKVNGATDLNNQVVVEPAVAPATAVRAMRVLADGTILVKPGGNLSMGDFTAGAQP
jgi:hypothetical protein